MSENDVFKIKIEPIDDDYENFVYNIDTKIKIEEDSDPTTNINNTKELSSRKSVGKFSQYHKQKILNLLLGNTYNPELFREIFQRFPTSQNDIFDWLQKGLKDAENHVHEEINSKNFTNISGWLEHMKNNPQLQYNCYEPAVIMDTIAKNEVFPEPSELGGIDLKSVYQFMYHALLGLPQPHLDPVSGAFLAKEFQDLIDEVNKNVTSDQLNHLRQHLLPYFMKEPGADGTSFDPFNLLSQFGNTLNN